VMFAALIFIVPLAMFFEFGIRPPGWVHILIWPPVRSPSASRCCAPSRR
jgi:hypothetical protein